MMIDFLASISVLLTEVRVELLPHFTLSGPFISHLHRFACSRVYLQTLVLIGVHRSNTTSTPQVEAHGMSWARRCGWFVIVEEGTTWRRVVLLILFVIDVCQRVLSGHALRWRLTLKKYQLRGRWVIKNSLEMHCVMNLILGLEHFLELKVIMTIS